MTQAERAKLRRSREALGLACYMVEVGPRGFNMLVSGGLLNDNEADDRQAVQRALAEAIEILANLEEASRVTAMARGQPYNGLRKETR